VPQYLTQRGPACCPLLGGEFRFGLPELGCFLDLGVDEPREQQDENPDEERKPPAPTGESRWGGDGSGDQEHCVGADHAEWNAHLHEAAVEPALAFGRVFDCQQRRTAPLRTDCDALQYSQYNECDGRENADRGIRR
jgi:hypothetical protein